MTFLNVSILLYDRKKYFALLSVKYSFWSLLSEAYETKVGGREEPTFFIQWLLLQRRGEFNSPLCRSHSWGALSLPGSSIPRQRKLSICLLGTVPLFMLTFKFLA